MHPLAQGRGELIQVAKTGIREQGKHGWENIGRKGKKEKAIDTK